MPVQKCCLNSHFNLQKGGNGCMREYENGVNSKAPVLTPSEIHFAVLGTIPMPKHLPTGLLASPNQVPLHFIHF